MIAVIDTDKPFGGISVNLRIPVSRSGVVAIDVPDLPQLPPLISTAYPQGTRLVMTKLSVTIDAPRRRRSKPFVWVRTPRRLGMKVQAITE